MMRKGILVSTIHDWKIWIGQQDYEAYEGMSLEIRIQNRYLRAYLGKDQFEWYVTLEEDSAFNLRVFEVYKVRVQSNDLISEKDVSF